MTARPAPRRALVTGAGRRVGKAIALALGREKMHVAVHYHSSEKEAEGTCEEIEALGGRATKIRADLRSRDGARRLVDDAAEKLGGLDVLVPSAAGYERVLVEDVDDAAWDRMLELNLASPFALAHRAIPLLRASNGCIVFITCASATTPYRCFLPYTVSKGGLRHLMRTLAVELAPDVRVNAVAPGTVLPPEDMSAEELEKIRKRIPLGRIGTAEDVAQAVVYLVHAPFVSGHEILVDGARTVLAF